MIIVDVPEYFQPAINIEYPKNNKVEFERWFLENYKGEETERVYLPVLFTAFHVNHNYGNDIFKVNELQQFIDSLDRNIKYFTICQYDDGVLIDFKDLDVLQFNMSNNLGYPLPLIGQAHPYYFNSAKRYLANFVGNITHELRRTAMGFEGNPDYYISFRHHDIEDYCWKISQSYFTLCYRGYGANSFRICEALQYGSVPVYISDEFIEAHEIPFETYGIKIKATDIDNIDTILRKTLADKDLYESLLFNGKQVYKEGYTYEGCYNKIINKLKK